MKISELTQKFRSSSTFDLCSLHAHTAASKQSNFIEKKSISVVYHGSCVKVKPGKPPI